MSRFGSVLYSVLLWSLPIYLHGQNPATVRQIQITSGGSGIRALPTATVLIQKDGDIFREGDRQVDPARISALVHAMQEPNNLEPNLDDLGITPAWLKANASSVAQKESGSLINGVKPDLRALEAAFADPETMDKIALDLFHSSHTDDFPSVEVLVTFTDGSSLTAETHSQRPLLLPWRIHGTAYNADISRAVAALLPEKATNRSRLSGENLDTLLAGPLMVQIRAKEHMTEVEAQTGTALSAIRNKYTILNAYIHNIREPGASKAEPEEASLLLDVKSADLPPSLIEHVMLPYKDGRVIGVDAFLHDAQQYEKIAVSIPWLNQYLPTHRTSFQLFFAQGVSFTDAAFRLFSADMQAIGREGLLPEVNRLKRNIALVSVGYGIPSSEWLVFPDGHMILWRYRLLPTIEKTLLTWPVSDLHAKPCSEPAPFLSCVGRVIDRDGNLN